jgi:hypothetical protein
MTGFPNGLSRLELDIQWVRDAARSDGGFRWETESADPYWAGKGSTSKLNADRLQDWEGFAADAVSRRQVIDFVDPVYFFPAAYRVAGLPGGFSGTGTLVSLVDPSSPTFAGLPLGLVLRRGDRLNLGSGGKRSYHRLRADVTVTSISAQALPIAPFVLGNMLSAGAILNLVNPSVRLMLVANSWSAPRAAKQLTIGSFAVEEAPPT